MKFYEPSTPYSAPDTPLQAALRAKDRAAAQTLLASFSALTRRQAADLAPLTLGWAADLLAQILDKTSGPPFAWLRHEVRLNDTPQTTLTLHGSLVMMAAALNDVDALNLLLSRGGRPDYDFRRDRWDIVGDLLMDGVTMGALNSPEYSLYQMEVTHPFPDDTRHELLSADPLSAAIFCDAKECAARLLKEPSVTVTPAVRRALARMPLNETQAFVARQLNTPLEDLLLPEDFGSHLNHPLLPKVLEKHGGMLPREQIKAFVTDFEFAADAAERIRQIDLFALLDAELLGDVVWEVWLRDTYRTDLLELASTFALPLDRCRVPEQLPKDTLTRLMENFYITDDAPEEGLSGLACALLHLLEGSYRCQPLSVEQLLCIPGARRVLAAERPELLMAWLNTIEAISGAQVLPLLALLDIHKEATYEL